MPLFLAVLISCLLAVAGAPEARAQDQLAVTARNLSVPDVCAEKDNVEIDFSAPAVRSFRLQAMHPAYMGTIASDRFAPDFSSCSFRSDARTFADGGQRVTLFETPTLWLVGFRLKQFWHPADTTVRVGDRVESGLHIVQLWMLYRERAEEIMVFYPPDGYWRVRPLPFEDMRWTAYGSSILIGPVETKERPIVDLKDIAFDPDSRTFTLQFRRGGSAKLKLQAVDQDHISLDVTYDGAMPGGLPFAAMRSMYATELNSDAARVAWLTKGAQAWREDGIMSFPTSDVTEFWAGRRVPARHNTSAPDMSFSRFSTSPAP